MELVAVAVAVVVHRPRRCCSCSSRRSRSSTSTSGCSSSRSVGRARTRSRARAGCFVVPIAQRGIRVDLREQFIEVPSQTGITKDNAPISIDFLIYWRIVDPYKSVVEVQNFEGALQNIATTTLRAVVGDILLDDVLSKREQINEVLRVKLDEVTERWGGKVTTVEIREITPPRDVQDAMNRQLSAERTRRAVITESEGTPPVGDQRRRGHQAGRDPARRGRPPGGDPARRGLRARARDRSTRRPRRSTRRRWRSSTWRRSRRSAQSPSTKYIIPLEITQLADSFRGYLEAPTSRLRRG